MPHASRSFIVVASVRRFCAMAALVCLPAVSVWAEEPTPTSAPTVAETAPETASTVEATAVLPPSPVVPSVAETPDPTQPEEDPTQPEEEPESAASVTTGGTAEPSWQVWADLRLGYEGRILSDGAGGDHKLVQRADLDIAWKDWDHLRFTFSGDLREDLDGLDANRAAALFETKDHRVYGFIYRATVELHHVGVLETVRLGRQFTAYQFDTHFDGAHLALRFWDKRVRVFAYGGLPVRHFADSDYQDAQTAGAGVQITPIDITKISLEYRFHHEDSAASDGMTQSPDQGNIHEASLGVRQNFLSFGYVGIDLGMLNKDLRHLKVSLAFLVDAIGFEAIGSYYYQFITIENLPSSLSPYLSLMGPVKPYQYARLLLSQRLYKDHISLTAGGELRYLAPETRDAPFNHSFHHEYLGLVIDRLPLPCLSFSVQADLWQGLSGENDNVIVAASAEARYRRQIVADASLGFYYSLYRYDYYLQTDEQTNVYTLYLDGRYFLYRGLYAKARYELNIYDLYEHRIAAALGWRF